MPAPERPPADRLPEWVERAKIAAGWMIGLRPPVTTFGRDVQGLVVIAAQMADLLPEALQRFRRTEDCIGQGDCPRSSVGRSTARTGRSMQRRARGAGGAPDGIAASWRP